MHSFIILFIKEKVEKISLRTIFFLPLHPDGVIQPHVFDDKKHTNCILFFLE